MTSYPFAPLVIERYRSTRLRQRRQRVLAAVLAACTLIGALVWRVIA